MFRLTSLLLAITAPLLLSACFATIKTESSQARKTEEQTEIQKDVSPVDPPAAGMKITPCVVPGQKNCR